MGKPLTEGAQLLNLARSQTERVRDRYSTMGSDARSRYPLQDIESFIFSFWLSAGFLLQGRPWHPGIVGTLKRLQNGAVDVPDVLGFIDSCSQIREKLVTHGYWDSALFKGLSGRWVRGLVCLIDDLATTSLFVHPSRDFDALVTWLGWLKRLPVCIRPIEESVESYKACERRISSINFDDIPYVAQLREIWVEWLADFRITRPFLPRHGSGSTADAGRVRSHKWDHMLFDRRSYVCFRYPDLQSALTWPIGDATRIAKVKFVPKQAGKDRTICMEPAWLQYLQQGVARQLVSYISARSHPLRSLVDIRNQDVNRTLCARAFVDGYATTDLSDASDSVSWRLIRILVRGLPIARYLYGSRSDHVTLAGNVVKIDKYAPMGSALCFPIECILFASIVELAHRIHYGKASKGSHSGCSVYGDDIICPEELYELVHDILVCLGFVVNTAKSFCGGGYFESCGVEYLYGVRITTIRHPRNSLLPKRAMSPDQIGLITDLANTMLQSGYLVSRRMLLLSYKDATIRVNKTKIVPFMQAMRFDDDHCVTIEPLFDRGVWSQKLQRRVRPVCIVETYAKSSHHDLTQYRADMCEPWSTRDSIHEKWSLKAISFLRRTGHLDLLYDGDIHPVGAQRTGRLQHRLRRLHI